MRRTHKLSPPNLLLAIATSIACLLWVGVSAFATWSTYVNIPFGDQWEQWAPGLTMSLSELFRPHNEHRIVVSRLLFYIDTHVFSGSSVFNLVMVSAFQFGACLILALQVASSPRLSAVEKSLLTLLSFVLSFWAYNYENLMWGFQHQWTATLFFSFAAFAIFLRNPDSWKNFALALGLIALATYSLSNGMLAGFALVIVAVLARARKSIIVALLAGVILLCVSYFWDYRPPNAVDALHQPGRVLAFCFVYIGAPLRYALTYFGASDVHAAMIIGTGVAALSVCVVVRCLLRPADLDRIGLFALAIVLFMGATCFVTALGRGSFDISVMWSGKYGTMVVQLYTAVLILVVLLIREVRWLSVGAITALIVYAISTQSSLIRESTSWIDGRKLGMTALLTSVHDLERLHPLYPSVDALFERTELLRARHLSIFSQDWPHWLGHPLADSGLTIGPGCGGAIDEPMPVTGGARVDGWAWDRALKRAPSVILLADEQNRIVGVALSGYERQNVPEIDGRQIGWQGHVTTQYGSKTVRALALSADHRSACELAGQIQVAPNKKEPGP